MPKRKRGAGAYTSKKRKVAPTVKKYVKRQLAKHIERKFTWTDGTDSPWTTMQLHKLGMPVVGTGDTTNRIGDRIHLTSIDMRYTLLASDTTNFVRLIFFQWKGNVTQYAPQATDILPALPISHMTAPIEHDGQKGKEFNILYDKVHAMSSTGGNAAKYVRKFMTRGFGRDIQFDNGGTNGTNALYLLTVSDSGAAPHPTLDYRFRLNYTDA